MKTARMNMARKLSATKMLPLPTFSPLGDRPSLGTRRDERKDGFDYQSCFK